MAMAPVQLIIAAFDDPEQAGTLLGDLRAGRRAGLIGIVDAAAVVADADGRLRITNARHRGRRGLVTGGVVGGTLALLAGPLGWGTAAGAGALGGLLGRARGAPFRAAVEELAGALPPQTSLLVAVVEHTWVEEVTATLEQQAARLLREQITGEIRSQLEAGGSLAFSLLEDTDAGQVTVAGARQDADGSAALEAAIASRDGLLLTQAELTPLGLTELLDEPGSADEDPAARGDG